MRYLVVELWPPFRARARFASYGAAIGYCVMLHGEHGLTCGIIDIEAGGITSKQAGAKVLPPDPFGEEETPNP